MTQQKSLLIHGYGKALDWGYHKNPSQGGFPIFADEIVANTAQVFDWSSPVPFHILNTLNPYLHLQLYFRERSQTSQQFLQHKLLHTLQEGGFESVVCHSLGARLLINTLTNNPVPVTLRQIIFVGADVPAHTNIDTLNQERSIEICNIYCRWDPALLYSVCMHRTLPAGLIGLQSPQVHNIHFPYRKGPNLHQEVWSDLRLKKLLDLILRKTVDAEGLEPPTPAM